MRRLVMVLTVALVMAAMMLAMAMPAFAKNQSPKEGSCGIVGAFPVGGQAGSFDDCGVENNPNFKKNKFPSGGGLEG